MGPGRGGIGRQSSAYCVKIIDKISNLAKSTLPRVLLPRIILAGFAVARPEAAALPKVGRPRVLSGSAIDAALRQLLGLRLEAASLPKVSRACLLLPLNQESQAESK